ncbi:phospholipase D-like domain-containing protein [Sutcliffiella halmapala]|uniref:hypothetical protein n=1 Tax=Sutcliffiella halmapala TaxID=79882 RepID=UPI001115CA0B|nr:hypothetical protein [Sutcliffiella halmapala]
MDLIDNAEERIDITYHSIQDGVAASLFFTSLLEAACRGVQVRVILDGMFHHVRGALKIVSSLGSSRQIAKEMNVTYHLEKVEVSTKNRH